MRLYTARILTFAMLASIGMTSACGEAASPMVAGLGGEPSTGTNSSRLVISPNQVQLVVGGTAQLSTNAPTNLQNQVQWASSPTTIASISPSGLVTALAAGTATITARYSSDTTQVATASVVVTRITTP